MERPKIELYRVRSFGEKLNDTFAFVTENFRVLLKYLTYFLLPLSLVQAVALNGYLGSIMSLGSSAGTEAEASSIMRLGGSIGAYILLYGIGAFLLIAVVYALMRLYGRRVDRLAGLTWAELKPELLHVMRRNVVLVLFGIALSVVFGLLMAGGTLFHNSLLLFVLIMVAMIVVALPLALLYPIYLFEDATGLWAAFRKAFHIGFPTWGGILAVLIVLGIVAGILQGVASIPWYVAFIVKGVFGWQEAEDTFVNSVGYSFLTYLLGVIQTFGSFLAYSLYVIGLAIQYGHAAEKVDSVTVGSDIEHFEQL